MDSLEAPPHSNLVFQLPVHLLGISGFKLGPHYCQLPVADEVQPNRSSCPAVLTVEWSVLDSNYTRQTSKISDISHVPHKEEESQRKHKISQEVSITHEARGICE